MAEFSRRVYLIDASIYIFYAWFSVPAPLRDSRGAPINALHGYAVIPQWLGVRAGQLVDMLALTGNAVDNIPGASKTLISQSHDLFDHLMHHQYLSGPGKG